MKKVLALILALLMVCSLVACGSSGGDDDKSGNSAKKVAQAYADAYESGDFGKVIDLMHKDVVEHDGASADDVDMSAMGDIDFTVDLSDGEDLDDNKMEEIKTMYADEYDLEVEDAQQFTIEITVMGQSMEQTLYIVKIDGDWYLGYVEDGSSESYEESSAATVVEDDDYDYDDYDYDDYDYDDYDYDDYDFEDYDFEDYDFEDYDFEDYDFEDYDFEDYDFEDYDFEDYDFGY